jgi:ABC-type glutathione transport system ATPase component
MESNVLVVDLASRVELYTKVLRRHLMVDSKPFDHALPCCSFRNQDILAGLRIDILSSYNVRKTTSHSLSPKKDMADLNAFTRAFKDLYPAYEIGENLPSAVIGRAFNQFGYLEFNQENLEHALRISKLDKWVETLDNGVHSYLNHDGNNLSGGQRQRIGIARALYSRPKLVFFDEATSSLDAATEMEIADSISDLANEVSVILIAHRLSSIKKSDMVVYIDRGKIVAQGTFDEVRNLVPDFDHQAQLMGL